MTKINNPHDRMFRASMMNLEVAKDFLNEHLPESIKSIMNFEKLRCVQKSFVSKKFKEHIVDVLYQTELRGRIGYIYTLCEHQSTIQKLLPFRVMQYLLAVLDYHHDQYPGKYFPVIWPLIFYTGSKTYNESTNFFDLFGENKEMMQKIVLQPFQLIDVNHIDDDIRKVHVWSGTLSYIYKHARTRDLYNLIHPLKPELIRMESLNGIKYIEILLNYAVDQAKASNVESAIETLAEEVSGEAGGKIMTAAEYLKQKGIEIGVQQGLEQGLEKGRIEVQKRIHQIVIRMLNRGVSAKHIADMTGLLLSDVQQIQTSLETL